ASWVKEQPPRRTARTPASAKLDGRKRGSRRPISEGAPKCKTPQNSKVLTGRSRAITVLPDGKGTSGESTSRKQIGSTGLSASKRYVRLWRFSRDGPRFWRPKPPVRRALPARDDLSSVRPSCRTGAL